MAEINLPRTGGKKYTAGTDSLSRADWNTQADAYEDRLATYDQGTRAARPAAGVEGRYYWATDENAVYYDDGAVWAYAGVRYWAAHHPGPVTLNPNNNAAAGAWSLATPAGTAVVRLSGMLQVGTGVYSYRLGLRVDGTNYTAALYTATANGGVLPYTGSVYVPFTAATHTINVHYDLGSAPGAGTFIHTNIDLMLGQPL